MPKKTESSAPQPRRRFRRANADTPHVTDFAMVDPFLFGLSLFQPLPRRDRGKAREQRLEIRTKWEERKWRVVSPFILGSDDLMILLAVLGLCGLVGNKPKAAVPDDPRGTAGGVRPMALRGVSGETIVAAESEASRVHIEDELETRGVLKDHEHFKLRTTIYALSREAGLSPTGDAYERIKESLFRMATIIYADEGAVGSNARSMTINASQRLLSARIEEDTGSVMVVVNARFTSAMFNGQFIHLDMHELRGLSEMAWLLHLKLAVAIRSGSTKEISTDSFTESVYGSCASSERERLDRRATVRQGLRELGERAGWSISENNHRQLLTISRT